MTSRRGQGVNDAEREPNWIYKYYIRKPDRNKAAMNVSRHLKINGFFVITIPRCDEIERRRRGNDLKNSLYEIKFERDDSPEYVFKLGDQIDNC